MKKFLVMAAALVAVFLISATDAEAQVDPQQCDPDRCCISKSCCWVDKGYCDGTCTCTFTCGGKRVGCSCECEPPPKSSVTVGNQHSRLGGGPACGIGTGPISLQARSHVATKDGPQTLDTIVDGIREMSFWRVQLPPQFDSHEVEGMWDGTFEEVVHEIARAYHLRALMDEPSKTITFVPEE